MIFNFSLCVHSVLWKPLSLYQRTHGANCSSQFDDRGCELLWSHVLNVSAKKVLPNMKRNQNNCDHGLFLWKGQRIYIPSPIPHFLPYRSWSCTTDRKEEKRHFALIWPWALPRNVWTLKPKKNLIPKHFSVPKGGDAGQTAL